MASSSSIGQFLRTALLWSRPGNTASNTTKPQTNAADNSSRPSKAEAAQTSSIRIFLSQASLQQALTYPSPKSSSQNSGSSELGKALPDIRASRKNAARGRLAQLKTQIEALQRLFATSGPNGSKAMAVLLKTLAAELKLVASELSRSDGGDTGVSTVIPLSIESPQAAPNAVEGARDASVGAADETGETSAAAAGADAAADKAVVAADEAGSVGVGDVVDTAEHRDGRLEDAGAALQSQASGRAQEDMPSGGDIFAAKGLDKSSSDGMSVVDKNLLTDVASKLKRLVVLMKMQFHGAKNKDIEKAEASLKETFELVSR